VTFATGSVPSDRSMKVWIAGKGSGVPDCDGEGKRKGDIVWLFRRRDEVEDIDLP